MKKETRKRIKDIQEKIHKAIKECSVCGFPMINECLNCEVYSKAAIDMKFEDNPYHTPSYE
jgi:ribosomal protein L37E